LIVLAADHQLDVDVALGFAKRTTFRWRLANILDRASYDILGYPLPGRSVHASMEVQL
jgi:outer membrane cobalamin receptor